MPDYSRDINIGNTPVPETTREVLEDLKVGENLQNIKDTSDEQQETLELIKTGVDLALGQEVEEAE